MKTTATQQARTAYQRALDREQAARRNAYRARERADQLTEVAIHARVAADAAQRNLEQAQRQAGRSTP